MTLIVDPKNAKEAKVVKAFLESLSIRHYTETQEDIALVNAMDIGRKSKMLNKKEKIEFLKKLSQGK